MEKDKVPDTVNDIVISVELVNSEAFRSLKRKSIFVYLDMLIRSENRYERYKVTVEGKPTNKQTRSFTYTYKEADAKGLKTRAFRNAIIELKKKGFINIVKGTGGKSRSKSKYRVIKKWKKHEIKSP